jgi:hypothetical protein
MVDWQVLSPLLTLLLAAVTLAYTAGVIRQRVADLERRVLLLEHMLAAQTKILEEIRERLIAVDVWQKLAAGAGMVSWPKGREKPLPSS